jgi:regulator of replication initiation timing
LLTLLLICILACFSPPQSNEFDDLFTTSNICIDSSFNPDEFLNLDQFDSGKSDFNSIEIKQEFTSCSPQQLTPPISPQPNNSSIVISNRQFRIIPMTQLNANYEVPAKKIKAIFPKPSASSSDSDSNNLNVQTNPTIPNSPVDKEFMKRQRLIKNRESAILSRKKQKEYLQTLETKNNELLKENTFLKAENSQLKARLKSYTLLSCRCASSVFTKIPSKNVTCMLAICFMVSFNIVPFGNFIYTSSKSKVISPQQFSPRHLLFVENSTAFTNNSSSTESPDSEEIYFNQTDHIRKVNIENIRRWIPEPDLNTSLKNDFSFHDPLQEKLAKMYEKSRENREKSVKTKKRPTKKKPLIGPVQKQLMYNNNKDKNIYNSNLNIIKLNEFFDEINRKDDTFYVFSFKADHLLLPAIDSKYNFSQIKMNLIMPRNNGKIWNEW